MAKSPMTNLGWLRIFWYDCTEKHLTREKWHARQILFLRDNKVIEIISPTKETLKQHFTGPALEPSWTSWILTMMVRILMNGLTKIDEGYGTAIDSTTIGLKRMQRTEADVKRCSVEKVFLEISQNSQENTYARVSILIKLQSRLY